MQSKIRNFCILAHVDHGKSTLCDRFLELTKTVSSTKKKPQFLDTNPISRERGITIKLAPVRMVYKSQIPNPKSQTNSKSQIQNSKQYKNITIEQFSNEYILNLIDTPGHVDFSYEVSRSLAACEGAILLIDASRGIQAQTLSYFQKAKEEKLAVLPVVNKIDLPSAQPEETALALMKVFDFRQEEIVFASAKTGEGVKELLEAITQRVPPPKGKPEAPLRGLIFDSFYDLYKGVVCYLRIVDGRIATLEGGLKLMSSNTIFSPLEMGFFNPKPTPETSLENGMVGYIATGLKDISLARVGETVTEASCVMRHASRIQPLPGYQQPKPMVFGGVYPADPKDYQDLKEGLEKLQLNDASVTFKLETSQALGKGFRIGFLGPLHAEIIIQRLEREFGLELVSTMPNVEYKVKLKAKSEERKARSVAEIPENYDEILEPVMKVIILTPQEYLGRILELCRKKRGELLSTESVAEHMVVGSGLLKMVFRLPLSEIAVGFFESLKSLSSGFASFDYQFLDYFPFDGVKLDILIGGYKIDALSTIVSKSKSYQFGKSLVEKLARVIPRQMFDFAIQAAVKGRVIARATKKAFRKDVTAKLYGGDQTRKDKLLKKQKKGKKRMKAIGKVFIPQEAFLAALKEK